MWPGLARREAFFNRSELGLVVGPPSAGKSLLMMNYAVRAQVPTLAFFLDSDRLTVASRFGSILTGDTFREVKEDIDSYKGALDRMENTQVVFTADDLDDIRLQGEAFEQRYGVYPSLVIIDNLGNLTSAMGDEWALLKALTLEFNNLAHEWECAIVAAHHMTDLVTCEPLQRDKMLGKVSQYPRLILSIGFNPANREYKVAVVKNSSGPSDPQAANPVVMYADTSRMKLSEDDPLWSPSGSLEANRYSLPESSHSVARGGWSAL
nr:ATP-binding protein [Trebonia kvetii]